MDYIEKTLGEHVTRQKWQGVTNIPYYLHYAYNFEQATIGTQKCLILSPKGELDTISAIKKNIRRIQKEWDYQILFEMEKLSRQRKETLIKEKIPFVVPGKQLYIPFMGVALQEKCDASKATDVEKLSPSSQVLLFLFIYGNNEPLYHSEVQKRLGFKPMRVTRAAAQLVDVGLLKTYTDNIRKVLTSELTPKELFEKAKPYLLNPVRRKIYIDKSDVQTDYFLAGESALSIRTMLSYPQIDVYGTTKAPSTKKIKQLVDNEAQCTLEVWRYNPTILSDENGADVLSLAISLGKIQDERVEMSIEEMLNNIWRDEK
ncbi:MAG: MarR family transcriptional regulator [Oscillospiraceae bacterium]|nr:MarR family transcriptional regulator [Oscillospiraceae bacterium]